jgi:CxxC motif-containing protein
MADFPDIARTDFSVGGDRNMQAIDMLDFAYTYWHGDSSRRKELDKKFNYHNGYIDTERVKFLTHITGKESKIKFERYNLGRAKMKLLFGEYLRMGLNPTARAINPEAQNEKLEKYKSLLGLSYAKPYIEKAKEMGYDVYPGVQIPDKDDKSIFNEKNFKVLNEIIMQHIINEKIKTEDILIKSFDMFVDLVVTSECHGRVYRTPEGIDTIRRINPKNKVMIEQDNDPFGERSPYHGEVDFMHYHEILNEFDLTTKEKEELGRLRTNGGEGCYRSSERNKEFLIPVLRLEWRCYAPVRTKIEVPKKSNIPYYNNISNSYYNDNKERIDGDVGKGKYKLETKYKQTMWTGVRISTNIYKNIKEKEFVIQQRDQNGKYRAKYDYFTLFLGTVDGTRKSLQDIMVPLEEHYDEIKYLIRKETSKIKGLNIVWDSAFTEGKQYKDIMHDITEEGLVEINSAADGHVGFEHVLGKIKPFDTLDLGVSSALVPLLNVAMDIERTMDRITGLNNDRQGMTKATTTATTNVNNLEASQSMTYDIFFFMNSFMNKGLTKLAEKTKINWAFLGEDGRMIPYGDDVIRYMKATRSLTNDDYALTISDGRKEFEIRAKAEQWFNAQLNNGQMTSADAIEFWTRDSMSEALGVIRKAEEKKMNYERENRDVQLQMEQAKLDYARQMAMENREDIQKQETDIEILKGEIKKEVEGMKIQGKAAITQQSDFQKNNISIQKEQTKNLLTNP